MQQENPISAIDRVLAARAVEVGEPTMLIPACAIASLGSVDRRAGAAEYRSGYARRFVSATFTEYLVG
jgi:hypothetical protein